MRMMATIKWATCRTWCAGATLPKVSLFSPLCPALGATALIVSSGTASRNQDLRDGDQDSASKDNIRDQHVESKDLQVSNKEVGVGSIGNDNLLVGQTKDRFPKCHWPTGEHGGSLGKGRLFDSRLENFLQSLAAVKKEPYCG